MLKWQLNPMDRAGNVMRKLGLDERLAAEDLARAAWPHAVGKRIAARTRAVSWSDGCLTIEVEDSVWLTHLKTMRGHLIGRLQALAGKEAVRAIQFLPGVPRREPQRAESVRPALYDEADSIRDPSLRRIYKASRARSA